MTSRTRNLKLIVDDNLSNSAKFNLNKIDALASVFNLDNTLDAVIKSVSDIVLRPHDSSIGGDGIGGTVTLGDVSQPLTVFTVNADEINYSAPVGLGDQASGGSKNLRLTYDSALSGLVDAAADRTLTFDLNGANRSLILGGSLSLLTSSLSLTAPVAIAWTLPATPGTNGQVLTNNGSEVLSWASPLSGGGNSTSATWAPGDGASKTVTHNFNTFNVMAQVLDSGDSYTNVEVVITRPTLNTITFTSTEAPVSNWLVLMSSTN